MTPSTSSSRPTGRNGFPASSSRRAPPGPTKPSSGSAGVLAPRRELQLAEPAATLHSHPGGERFLGAGSNLNRHGRAWRPEAGGTPALPKQGARGDGPTLVGA